MIQHSSTTVLVIVFTTSKPLHAIHRTMYVGIHMPFLLKLASVLHSTKDLRKYLQFNETYSLM